MAAFRRELCKLKRVFFFPFCGAVCKKGGVSGGEKKEAAAKCSAVQ